MTLQDSLGVLSSKKNMSLHNGMRTALKQSSSTTSDRLARYQYFIPFFRRISRLLGQVVSEASEVHLGDLCFWACMAGYRDLEALFLPLCDEPLFVALMSSAICRHVSCNLGIWPMRFCIYRARIL